MRKGEQLEDVVSASPRSARPCSSAHGPRSALLALVALLLGLVIAVDSVRAQQYNVRRYTAADGLPDSRIHSILQDSRGYLWFGTGAGLARYDGSAFDVIDVASQDRRVTVLAEDGEGRVVFALQDGGIGRIEANGAQPWSDDRVRGTVRAIHRDREGILWLALDGSVAMLGDDAPRVVVGGDSAPPECCTAVWLDRTQRAWIGTGSGLYRWSATGLEAADSGLPPGVAVTALIADRADVLWVGTERGLFRQVGDRFTPVAAAGEAAVRAAAMDEDGVLWFGTERGALRMGAAPFLRLGAGAGLGDERVNSVTVDREGNVWFGTDGGVAKLVGSRFAVRTAVHGLLDPYVVDVARHPLGGALVATRRGVARVRGGQMAGVLWELDDLAATQVTAVAAASSSGTVVGTSEGVLLLPEGGEAVSLGSPPVAALSSSAEGVWVGTARGLYRLVDTELTKVATGTELDELAVVDLAADEEGLWVATREQGVWRGTSDAWRPVLPSGEDPPDAVTAIGLGAEGGVWLATAGQGVMRLMTDGSTSRLTRAGNGLSSDHAYQVLPTEDRGVWIFTNRGLDRWDPERGIAHFDLGDGLPAMSGTPAASLEDAEGQLWFGTPAGLVELVAAPAPMALSPPVAVIREFLAGGVPANESERGTLSADRNDVSIAFSALTYRDEASTRFQVRLSQGATRGSWSRPGTERRVSFVDLAPGSYTFEVQAINEGGRWSEAPAQIRFTVRPRLWQTLWFRGLIGGLLLVAIGAVFRGRLRQVDDERLRLRGMVDKRTRELVEKNALLERMATTDELTGLPNRRFFLDSLERELRKLTRLPDDQQLSLLVIDLDRFKSVNDRFGHAAGDEVLRQVARRLGQGVRATDLPARYGGEEFAILLPGTGPDGALFLAEKLRGEVESMRSRFDGVDVDMTISVGVATVSAVSRYDDGLAEELLRRADEAMYRAKQSGRNRVVADEAQPSE